MGISLHSFNHAYWRHPANSCRCTFREGICHHVHCCTGQFCKHWCLLRLARQLELLNLQSCPLSSAVCTLQVPGFAACNCQRCICCSTHCCYSTHSFCRMYRIAVSMLLCPASSICGMACTRSQHPCLHVVCLCSSLSDTEWEESTPWLLAQLLSVLRPRVVHLPERGVKRYVLTLAVDIMRHALILCVCVWYGCCVLLISAKLCHSFCFVCCAILSAHVLTLVDALQVVMTFSMQGVGNFTNTAVLCVLLAIYTSTEANKKTHKYTAWR